MEKGVPDRFGYFPSFPHLATALPFNIMKKNIYALLILFITMVSCQKELKVEYPENDSKLTLNSVLSEGRTVSATLSSTLPYTNTGKSPFYKDGFITLYENGQLIDTLLPTDYTYRAQSEDTIWYYTSGHIVKAESSYRMLASRPGFDKVSATTRIPKKALVKNIRHTILNSFEEVLEIEIEDPESQHSFFMIEMASVDPLRDSTIATLISEDPTVELYSYFGLLKMPLDPERGEIAFFTDEYFISGKKKVILRARLDYSSGNVNQIIVYSSSEDYYEYTRSFAINSAFAENPFAEPIRVKTNVENGFGIVGGLSLQIINL